MLLFSSLGQAPIERAEIYFLDGARSMVERADWLVPYYRGEPFFDKPPLTYWLMALAFPYVNIPFAIGYLLRIRRRLGRPAPLRSN